jgi:hypothetical protein
MRKVEILTNASGWGPHAQEGESGRYKCIAREREDNRREVLDHKEMRWIRE